jgi:membrane-bound lytic murein transglycosylase B
MRLDGRLLGAAAVLAACLFAGPAARAQDDAGFSAFLHTLRAQALARGVSARTLDAVLPSLTLNPRVIELDRSQPGGTVTPSTDTTPPPFAPYRRAHVDAARISRGQSAYLANRARLAPIEAETGVPESIMVSIWGNETNYGSYTGSFDLPRALASLAYEGRRRDLFTDEFIAAMQMIDRGVPRARLVGSWAGAFGGPQFLPSVYLRLGRDGDGDGRVDLWSSDADTLASIANYFRNAGWRRGEPWGFAVTVPAGLDRAAFPNRLLSPRCPRVFARHSGWRTIAEWRASGLVPQSRSWPADSVQATLLEPDGPGATAYLLTSNYRVILDYNCSNFYALAVGLLADAVER